MIRGFGANVERLLQRWICHGAGLSYYSDPGRRGGVGSTALYPLTGILRSTYFCIPTNPKLLELGALIDNRLYKIRNSQDINGVSRQLSLYEPALDPGILMRAVTQDISLSSLLNDSVGSMPNFRFRSLLEKALDMCGELKGIAASFIANRRSKEAEGLVVLKSRQDGRIQTLAMDIKKLTKTEIEKTIE
ncbi:MAG: hypothetical protein Q9170_001962 [Blastenia crenularia]